MKEFIKWLGINDKVAKVAVWLLIIMVFLIITNMMLESIGFPYYKITYENMKRINVNKVIEYAVSSLIAILNFYSIVLLTFRVKESKKIFKYALLYLVLNLVLSFIFSKAIMQVLIFIYIVGFCYIFSGKNKKYLLYGTLSYVATVFIQGIWYLSKARFIDYSSLNYTTRSILSLDYFIIMGIIILVKEIYLKKRSEKDGRRRISNMRILDRRIQKWR